MRIVPIRKSYSNHVGETGILTPEAVPVPGASTHHGRRGDQDGQAMSRRRLGLGRDRVHAATAALLAKAFGVGASAEADELNAQRSTSNVQRPTKRLEDPAFAEQPATVDRHWLAGGLAFSALLFTQRRRLRRAISRR